MKAFKVANFEGKTISVGLDVHKKRWSTSIWFEGRHFKTWSMDPDPELLLKQLYSLFPGADYQIAYEAGFSGFWIQRRLDECPQTTCIVINPADIPTKDSERKQKNDKLDSMKIARTLFAGLLTGIHVPGLEQEGDRTLVRHRKNLVRDTARVKNRIRKLLMMHNVSIPEQLKPSTWSNRFIQWLSTVDFRQSALNFILTDLIDSLRASKQKLLKITREIRTLARSARYETRYQLLISTPGIGLIGAMTILTEIGDIERFKSLDKLASFTGLIPNTSSSGEHERVGGNTRRGNSFLKTILIEAAWVSLRSDPVMANAYAGYKERMKGQKAIIRIAKKLLARIRAVLTSQQPYRINIAG